MEDNILSGLSTYFNHLANYGYMKQSTVNKLILYIFIADFIEEYEGLHDNEVLDMLYGKLQCLQDSLCMISRYNNCGMEIFVAPVGGYKQKSSCN